jgi:3-keto-disaccharide hydrolase
MKNFCRSCLVFAILLSVNLAIAAGAKSEKKDMPNPDADGWYSLFNGKDFTGWKKSKDNPDTFQVVDGEIVVKGPVCHLYYDGPVNDAKFKNFVWKVEIMTKPHANSGMYFHTKYQDTGFPKYGIECQVNNTHSDPIKTGSLYKIANVMNDSPAKDNEWFTQTVTVMGKHITVKVNDKVVNDHTEPEHPERAPGWENAVLSSGTFALQGHDPGSEIHYRKIMVKPLP